MANYDHLETRVTQKLLDQQGEIIDLKAERDGAYRERAQLLAWLAALNPAVLAPAPDVTEDGWQILYLNPPAGGQMTWHIAPRDAELLDHVEQVSIDDERAQWDGHSTAEKYQRMANLIRLLSNAAVMTGAPPCLCTIATRCAVCRAGDVAIAQG
jgi:hypothetical protein